MALQEESWPNGDESQRNYCNRNITSGGPQAQLAPEAGLDHWGLVVPAAPELNDAFAAGLNCPSLLSCAPRRMGRWAVKPIAAPVRATAMEPAAGAEREAVGEGVRLRAQPQPADSASQTFLSFKVSAAPAFPRFRPRPGPGPGPGGRGGGKCGAPEPGSEPSTSSPGCGRAWQLRPMGAAPSFSLAGAAALLQSESTGFLGHRALLNVASLAKLPGVRRHSFRSGVGECLQQQSAHRGMQSRARLHWTPSASWRFASALLLPELNQSLRSSTRKSSFNR